MKELLLGKWEEILEYLKMEHGISDVSFRTWIQPLKIYTIRDNIITIEINDKRIGNSKEYIINRYSLPLKVSIEEIIGEEFELEFLSSTEIANLKPELTASNPSDKITKESNQKYPNLNPRYTFDTFVVGNNNSFAHAASLAVAEAPGEVYNPLFIYGGVGLGKTHLMHSIAHYILEQNPSAKVQYVTSEKFTNELIEAIRNKADTHSIAEFRKKYREIDVLLIDDIQFIIGKESTQEEFFHTFNHLHESKRQIILSSDKPPKDMEILEERLRSRFEWGLNVDIKSPDYETRMAILKKKEELDGLSIDNEVMKYIATNIKSNIRELEGALTQIVARSRLINKEVDVALAEEALKDLISPNDTRDITIELINSIVAEHFDITPADIISTKKSRNIAYPRQICMYLCRQLTDISFKEIGGALGGRDHTTVMHGCDKITDDLKTDTSLVNIIEVIKKKINPH